MIDTSRWAPYAGSLLRIMTGLLYLSHGLQKLFDFPAPPDRLPPPGLVAIVFVASILELVGGALIAVGFYTRIVAFILSGEMAVAYFMIFAPNGFFPILNGGLLTIMYCFVYFYFAFAGGGPVSVDNLIRKSPPAAV